MTTKKQQHIPEKWVVDADDIDSKVIENNNWKNLHSKSWCPVPFNTISWHPTGVITRCMMNDTPMGNSYDSSNMQELRQNMLDGKWDTNGCETCLHKEQHGYKSQRINWLSNKMRYEKLGDPEPYTTPKLTENKISHLFINFSNVCNFKCRMCSSNYSNSLIPENKHMTTLFPIVYKKTNGTNEKKFNNINEFLEANSIVLKDIRNIWMTGGEPFMDESPYKLMELIEKYGSPEKVRLTITTNGSKLDFKKLDKFKTLKNLSIDISIDAVGPMFEYMRSNGVFTWNQMKETCGKLKKYKQTNKHWFDFQINSSYQIFNYDNMFDFINFIIDHECDSNIRLLVFPKHLRVGNLPDSFKKEALAMCDKIEVLLGNITNQDTHVTNILSSLSDMRKSIKVEANSNPEDRTDAPHLYDFKNIVKEQDEFRKMYLYDYNPKLAEIVYGK